MKRVHNNISFLLISYMLSIAIGCTTPKPHDTDGLTDNDTTKPFRLLVYGGPPDLEWQSAVNVIAHKWGIQYYSVAGCVVTEKLVDSVDRHNKKVNERIVKKYGAGWKTAFDKEVSEEMARQKIASLLLDKEQRITTKRNELEKNGNGLQYLLWPTNAHTYQASIRGWGQLDGKDSYVSYFRYMVDIENKKAQLVSDSVIAE